MINNKHFSFKNIFTFVVMLLTTSNVLHIYSQQKTPTPEEIVKAIKDVAKMSANSNAIVIKKPELTYNNKNKELQYYLGSIKSDKLGLDSADPYIMPFSKQLQIESLKIFFSQNFRDEIFWKKALQKAEDLVLTVVRDIESTNDKEILQKKLDEREEQFSQLFVELHQGIKSFAQKNGYIARRAGGRDIASDSYTVVIIKKPSDGRVQVLPIVKYVQCNFLKKCGNNWPWRELVSESENLIGEYQYQAEWQDGRKNEGRIDIRNNTSITFAPK